MIMVARKSSLLRHLAWSATLAIGFGTLWSVLVAWLGTAILETWQGETRPPYESLVVRSDGTLLIQSNPRGYQSSWTYRDLKGQEQDAPERDEQITALNMGGEPKKPAFLSPRLDWRSRLSVFLNEREPDVNWFFVHDGNPDDGAGYFVAYNRLSNRRLGFIGMSGFRAEPVPPGDWIPMRGAPLSSSPAWMYSANRSNLRPGRWDVPPRWVYLSSGTNLRKVDLAERTVKTVLVTPDLIVTPAVPIVASWSGGRYSKERTILVRTTQEILELDQTHRVVRTFKIPTEVDRRSFVQWFGTDTRQAFAVFTRPSAPGEPENITKQMVYRVASSGAIEDQFELGLQTGWSVWSKRSQALGVALVIPAPLLLFVADLFSEIGMDGESSHPAALQALVEHSGPSFLAVLVLSVILAVMAWRRCGAYGLSRQSQFTWAIFVFLLGVPAYAGFLLSRRWPVREKCPSCRTEVPRDRTACARCGSLFPEPALLGTEIFA